MAPYNYIGHVIIAPYNYIGHVIIAPYNYIGHVIIAPYNYIVFIIKALFLSEHPEIEKGFVLSSDIFERHATGKLVFMPLHSSLE